MTELDFESDQFLELLTDALRAGPGSPQWHDAVTHLREQDAGPGGGGSSGAVEVNREYQLLIAARQHLESGREYRGVRPGPRFTSRVMQGIDEEADGNRRRRPSTTRVVAIAAGVLIVAAVVMVAVVFTRSGAAGADPAIDALAHTYFTATLLSLNFDGPLPQEWRTLGSLPIYTARGLRPAVAANLSAASTDTETATTRSSYATAAGGGVFWTRALPADKPVEVSAVVRVPRGGTGTVGGDDAGADATIAQLFVTDSPEFADDRGTSEHEFVWLVQAGQSKIVLPGGRVESQKSSTSTDPKARRPSTFNLRLALDRDVAIIEENGQPMWSGQHGLAADKPRYLGIRFLRTDGVPLTKAEQTPAVTSLKIQMP